MSEENLGKLARKEGRHYLKARNQEYPGDDPSRLFTLYVTYFMIGYKEVLNVSKSWYDERDDQTNPEDSALRDEIERIMLEFAGYGYRRVTRELASRGWEVNHKRVLRIMREEALLCQIKKRFVMVTTNSRHGFPVYPNVLADATLSAPIKHG